MNKQFTLMNLTVREILRPIFRQKLVIIVTVVLIMTFSFLGVKMITPEYEAKVLMHIKGVQLTAAETYNSIGGFRVHFTQMAFVKSDPVLKPVVYALNLHKRPLDYEKKFANELKHRLIDYRQKKAKKRLKELSPADKKKFLEWLAIEKLKANIQTVLRPNTDVFEIIVKDYSAADAIQIANVVSRSFVIFDLKQQLAESMQKYGILHPTILQLQDNIRGLMTRMTKPVIHDINALNAGSVKIVEQARTNFQPIGKSKMVIMALALFVSIFTGIALALLFDFMNQTFKLPEDIKRYLDIPVIGSIPQPRLYEKKLLPDIKRKGLYASFYRDLASNLYITAKKNKAKTILFISLLESKEKSIIMSNIGQYLSNYIGLKTLILDAEFDDPTLTKVLKIKHESEENNANLPALLDAKQKGLNIKNMVYHLDTNLDTLYNVNKLENPLAYIQKQSMKTVLNQAAKNYDFVLVNCSDFTHYRDAELLMQMVDGVVLIVNEGKDRTYIVQNALEPIKETNKILGAIMNNRSFVIPKIIYKRI